MMHFKDVNFYEILEIPTDASPLRIAQAYQAQKEIWELKKEYWLTEGNDDYYLACQKILERIDAAYFILSKEKSRKTYNEEFMDVDAIESLWNKKLPTTPTSLQILQKTFRENWEFLKEHNVVVKERLDPLVYVHSLENSLKRIISENQKLQAAFKEKEAASKEQEQKKQKFLEKRKSEIETNKKLKEAEAESQRKRQKLEDKNEKLKREIESLRRQLENQNLQSAQNKRQDLANNLLSTLSKTHFPEPLTVKSDVNTPENQSTAVIRQPSFFNIKENPFEPISYINPETGKLQPWGLNVIYRVWDIPFVKNPNKEWMFTNVRLVFMDEKAAIRFKEEFGKYLDVKDKKTWSFTLFRASEKLGKNILELNFMNSEASFRAGENPAEAGTILLEELAKWIQIEGITQEDRKSHNNEYFSEQEKELIHKQKVGFKELHYLAEEIEVSAQKNREKEQQESIQKFSKPEEEGYFNAERGKLRAYGLIAIYKILSFEANEEPAFIGVKLAFDSEERAQKFWGEFIDYTKQRRDIYLGIKRGSFVFWKEKEHEIRDKNVLEIIERTIGHKIGDGEKLLALIKKHIEMGEIREEYRKEYRNEPVSDKELPMQFRSLTPVEQKDEKEKEKEKEKEGYNSTNQSAKKKRVSFSLPGSAQIVKPGELLEGEVEMYSLSISVDKMPASGLKVIYEMKVKPGFASDGLRLKFDSAEAAQSFKEMFNKEMQKFQKDEGNFSFLNAPLSLKSEESIHFSTGGLVLEVLPMALSKKCIRNPARKAEILKNALAQFVDIEGIPIEVRDYQYNLIEHKDTSSRGMSPGAK